MYIYIYTLSLSWSHDPQKGHFLRIVKLICFGKTINVHHCSCKSAGETTHSPKKEVKFHTSHCFFFGVLVRKDGHICKSQTDLKEVFQNPNYTMQHIVTLENITFVTKESIPKKYYLYCAPYVHSDQTPLNP